MTRTLFLVAAAFAVVWPDVGGAGERAPLAAETVRSCPRHGPGFVEIPGTSTCMRIGGRVRGEAVATSGRRVSRDDIAGLRSSGQVSVDARTETPYGPLRSYVRVRAVQDGRP